jgi:hypothetical protein
MAACLHGWAADFCLENDMDSFDTARAMVEHYIKLGAAKIEEERQWREVAGQISHGYARTRGGVDSAGRLLGVTASRPMDGKSMRRNPTKKNTKW